MPTTADTTTVADIVDELAVIVAQVRALNARLSDLLDGPDPDNGAPLTHRADGRPVR